MRTIRSLLFAPGNRPDLLRKFIRYDCDAYAIDLEDATPVAEKVTARHALIDAVAFLREHPLSGLLFVRTNHTASAFFEADLSVALATAIDGVMLPKLASVSELRRVDAAINRAEQSAGRHFRLIGLLETAKGVVNAEAIATAEDSRLCALAFGAEDFITDMGGVRTTEGCEVLYARSRVVLAARAGGLVALDQAFTDIRDEDGFRRDATLGRRLGYTGKLCIGPRQAELANEAFSPTPDEILRSQQVMAAYAAAKQIGHGAIELEGELIDEPLLKRAEAVVALAARLS